VSPALATAAVIGVLLASGSGIMLVSTLLNRRRVRPLLGSLDPPRGQGRVFSLGVTEPTAWGHFRKRRVTLTYQARKNLFDAITIGLASSAPFDLRVVRRGLADRLRGKLGSRHGVVLGQPDLDARFVVLTDRPEALAAGAPRAHVTEAIGALINTAGVIALELQGRTMSARIEIKDTDTLRSMDVRWILWEMETIALALEGRSLEERSREREGEEARSRALEETLAAEERGEAAFMDTLKWLTPGTPGTKILVLANILVYILMVARGVGALSPTAESLLPWGADFGPLTLRGEWWRILTSTFVHIGAVHLICNMLGLLFVAQITERIVGTTGFMIVYFASGALGSLASLAWSDTAVSAGASGAIFGVYGVLLGFLSRRDPTVPAATLRGLGMSTLTFVAYNLVMGFADRHVGNAAHVGGLATGFVCGLLMAQPVSRTALFHRSRRNLLVGAGAAVAIVLSAVAVPKGIVALSGSFNRLSAIEERAERIVKSGAEGPQTAEGDRRTADALEREILPAWRTESDQIQKIPVLRADRADLMKDLTLYCHEREAAFALLTRGLRTEDAAILGRAEAKGRTAAALRADLESILGA